MFHKAVAEGHLDGLRGEWGGWRLQAWVTVTEQPNHGFEERLGASRAGLPEENHDCCSRQHPCGLRM